ncbi:FecR family protein [Dongia rigui]|uniref:FecR domain-containing protein n=1 Tax=Dongia rigui TaxID=940149 RepID=A0ABU5DVQ4_9PROT|nr:FecR domain-containing protein [Dongia rigui]MDY0871057.1 FecR domain-containing protein [Dongia rigui]
MRRMQWMTVLALGLAAAMPAYAEVGTPAGIAGAVSGTVDLISPAKQIATPTAVNSGDGLVMGDGVTTGAASRLQIMLLDESAITLGPDANLTIDEFVYDPNNANSALLNASIAKGVFRLVTGAIARQNPEGTSLKLPNAVLTIRGTTVMGACAATCVVALAGTGDGNTAGKKPSTVTLKSAKNEVVLKRAGYYVEIGADGTISDPRALTDAIDQRFAGLFLPLDAPGGPTGNFRPDAGGVIGQSGQPTQDGRPLAVNQREFEDAGNIGGLDLNETTSNLPLGEVNYASAPIAFVGGSGDGEYSLNATLSLASRSLDGTLTINHQDEGFVSQFALPSQSLDQGVSFSATGGVPGALLSSASNPNATYTLDYTLGQSAIGTNFQYDADGPGGTAFGPSTGSGDAPLVQ